MSGLSAWEYKDGDGRDEPCRCGTNAFKWEADGTWLCTNCLTQYASMEEIRLKRESL